MLQPLQVLGIQPQGYDEAPPQVAEDRRLVRLGAGGVPARPVGCQPHCLLYAVVLLLGPVDAERAGVAARRQHEGGAGGVLDVPD